MEVASTPVAVTSTARLVNATAINQEAADVRVSRLSAQRADGAVIPQDDMHTQYIFDPRQ